MGSIKQKLVYFREHAFVRNVVSLQVGSFLTNFLQAAAGVLIARLLQPQLFGVYSIAFGLAGLATILLGSGIQDAIISVLGKAYAQRDKNEISQAFAFLLKMSFITAGISLVVVFFLPSIAQKFYGQAQIGFFAGIVVLASIISSFFFSFSQIALQITGKIKQMTALLVADVTMRYALSVLLVFVGMGVVGAMSGHLIGAGLIFIIALLVWEWARKSDGLLPSLRNLVIQGKNVSLKKYFGFSFWVAVDKNIASLYFILPVVLTGIYVATTEVTFFKLAFGFVNLAMSLLGPISVLLNAEFPKMQIQEIAKMRRNFIRVSFYAMILSTVLTLGAIVVAPVIFKIIYGASFSPGAKYVFGFLIYGVFYGIGVGLGPMWRAIDKVKTSITINLMTLGIGVPLGLYLTKLYGVWGAIVTVTLWYTVSHFVSFFYLLGIMRNYNVKPMKLAKTS